MKAKDVGDLLLHGAMGAALVVAFKPYVWLGLAAASALGLARECWQRETWKPWKISEHGWREALAWPAGALAMMAGYAVF